MTVALVCGTWPAANVSVFWLIAGHWRTRFSLPGTNIWRRTSFIRVSSSTRSRRNATTANCWAPKTNSPASCWRLVRLWWTTHPAIHPSLCPYRVVKANSSRIKWRKMRWNVWNSSIANCTPLQPTRFSRKMRHRWPRNENNLFFLFFSCSHFFPIIETNKNKEIFDWIWKCWWCQTALMIFLRGGGGHRIFILCTQLKFLCRCISVKLMLTLKVE